MKKNLSYREKLLELGTIYRINEIIQYTKNKKYLTTSQIELLLKKNKVPIPSELNKSVLEIHSKKITKPFFSAGSAFKDSVDSSTNRILKSINFIFKKIKSFIQFIFNSVINFFKWIARTTINSLNSVYNFKVQEKKANRVVTLVTSFIAIFLIAISTIKIMEHVVEKENLTVDTKKIEKQKNPEVVKKQVKPEKKIQNKVEEKKPESVAKLPKKEKKSNNVSEFVLPNLNLKTETVLSLFEDVEYDLSNVRNNKLVKPIYFTQFPKDLIEITNIQLKKETFIKIVLPLVVAENQKILADRIKLLRIISKKMTSEKEKLWLRSKLKEYKVKNGNISELEKRMDIIPVSIALAQAAKESGWGTSRFALEGNAIFGQWTWSGSGIEPLNRSNEKSHKILRFPILRASVKAYKNNLNTHKSYKQFREKRSKARNKNISVRGLSLIHTLDSYAQTGEEYTKILEQIINQNNLDDFENVKLTNSVIKKQLNL